MNLRQYRYSALLFAGLALASCENTVDIDVTPEAGSVDFSNYVSIGNSLTAGYADGGLYAESQANSFPSILAGKMMEADPTMPTFVQPTVSGNGSGYITLDGLVNGSPQTGAAAPDANFLQKVSGPFNNMGVPGIRVLDITVNGYGADPQQGNPFFWRMLPETAPLTSYLEAVVASDPTFFTCWLGNNDVLGYATSGGAAGVNGAPNTFINGLTPQSLFQASYEGLIGALTADGTTKGVIATIPSVTDIPYFTAVPSAPIIPLDEATAAALNAGYDAQFNAGVNAWNAAIDAQGLPASLKRETINFVAGQNFPVIEDESLSDVALPNPAGGDPIILPKMRKMRQGELLLLTLPQAELATGLGTQNMIPTQYVLTEAELSNINTAIDGFNSVIRNIASSNPNVALWDANATFRAFVSGGGITQNGVAMDARFIQGGAFSLDGVHPTPRGYSWVANSFIDVINANFGSNMEHVSIGQYRGVKFP